MKDIAAASERRIVVGVDGSVPSKARPIKDIDYKAMATQVVANTIYDVADQASHRQKSSADVPGCQPRSARCSRALWSPNPVRRLA